MKDYKSLIVFVLAGVLFGTFLTFHFKTDLPVESTIPLNELEARESLLKQFLDEQTYLQSRIVTLRDQIDEAQKQIEQSTENTNLKLLEDLKQDMGLTEISGPGLEISLNDSPFASKVDFEDSEKYRIQASDLRDLVNLLNAASAEAIAINNQRIIANSTISAVGTTILINNSHSAAPFTITAVGDGDLMLERVLNKSLLPALYKKKLESKVTFEILKRGRVNVPIYNGDLKAEYLNLVE